MVLNTFTGRAQVSLDDKGRVSFPLKFRKGLVEADGDVFVVTIDQDGTAPCLKLYTTREWNENAERWQTQLREAPVEKRDGLRRAINRLMEMANQSRLDGQNRLTLTPELRAWAGIQNEAMYAASFGKTIRIYGMETYEKLYPDVPQDSAGAMNEALNELL